MPIAPLFSRILLSPLVLAGLIGLPAQALHVMVDPGHGGRDLGATHGGLRESDLALRISQLLAEHLRQDPDFKVTLTRTDDHYVSLTERVQMAQSTPADLFLSLHVNSSPDSRARGVEFYFRSQLPPDQEAMAQAARENANYLHHLEGSQGPKSHLKAHKKNEVDLIVEDLVEQKRTRLSSELTRRLDRQWRGLRKQSKMNSLRQAPFRVITQPPMPSALVEVGFLTNSREAQLLKSPEYQAQVALSLYRGLRDFKELMDKDRPLGLQ